MIHASLLCVCVKGGQQCWANAGLMYFLLLIFVLLCTRRIIFSLSLSPAAATITTTAALYPSKISLLFYSTFDKHKPMLIIFDRYVTVKVSKVHYFLTSPH